MTVRHKGPLTVEHSLWPEFVERLVQAVQFVSCGDDGIKVHCDHSFRQSTLILRDLGFSRRDITQTLAGLTGKVGSCDCEIFGDAFLGGIDFEAILLQFLDGWGLACDWSLVQERLAASNRPLPDVYCSELDLPSGSTFGHAVRCMLVSYLEGRAYRLSCRIGFKTEQASRDWWRRYRDNPDRVTVTYDVVKRIHRLRIAY